MLLEFCPHVKNTKMMESIGSVFSSREFAGDTTFHNLQDYGVTVLTESSVTMPVL